MPLAVEVRPHDVEQVIVHAHDARHHRIPVKIQHGCTGSGRHVRALLDRRDLSALDHDILIVDRRASGAVDNPHVGEHHLGRLHPHELLDRLR